MSRKDYIAIADVIREFNIDYDLKRSLIDSFADVLEKDNPRFNTHRFVTACWGKP